LTPAERAAGLQIPGLVELIDWFGFFPSFHDAEVISISLDRSGGCRVAVHTFETTKETDRSGRYVLRKHIIVTFVLERIKDVRLEGFNCQNVLSGISIARQRETYDLDLEGIYGVAGKIRAEAMRIELEPGGPPKSLFS
jgi:hypothetical protein